MYATINQFNELDIVFSEDLETVSAFKVSIVDTYTNPMCQDAHDLESWNPKGESDDQTPPATIYGKQKLR